MPKITKTFSVDNELFDIFDTFCKEQNVNRSLFIQHCISDFVLSKIKDDMVYEYHKNGDYNKYRIDKWSKDGDKYIYHISNGDLINIDEFRGVYRKCDDGIFNNSLLEIQKMIEDNG